MQWYFRISHPYMLPLPLGDPLRPYEQEAIMEKRAEMEGLLATRMGNTLTMIRRRAEGLLAMGVIGGLTFLE
jgi:hypothetical protein